MTDNATLDRLSAALTENEARSVIRTIFQRVADEHLVEAWERTGGAPGDLIADIPAVELARREVSFEGPLAHRIPGRGHRAGGAAVPGSGCLDHRADPVKTEASIGRIVKPAILKEVATSGSIPGSRRWQLRFPPLSALSAAGLLGGVPALQGR